MTEQELIERIARVAASDLGWRWGDLPAKTQSAYLDRAASSLTALREAIPGLDALIAGTGVVVPANQAERDTVTEILKSLTDKPGNPFAAFDVEEYVAEYEMLGEDDEGREGYYTPSEKEKALIADAIYGVLPQLQGDVRAMVKAAKGE